MGLWGDADEIRRLRESRRWQTELFWWRLGIIVATCALTGAAAAAWAVGSLSGFMGVVTVLIVAHNSIRLARGDFNG